MSSLVEDLDSEDPDVQEMVAALATSNAPGASLFHDLHIELYGDEP